MDVQFFGANCVAITYGGVRFVVDDNLAELGSKSMTRPDDILLYTGQPPKEASGKLILAGPGEYEVAGVSIVGIAARAHIDESGGQSATAYKAIFGDKVALFTGHIYPELDDKQLEAVGSVDVMFVPVGGHGYTLDGVGALKLVKQIEPKLVIPTYFADKKLKYPVPADELETALKELGMEPKETTTKLKIKPADFTDMTQLIVLERS